MADLDDVLDGNAASGVLSEIFAADMTVAIATCAACDGARPIGELRAHLHAPGVVLRCASCGEVEIKLVRAVQRAWLDVRGVRVLEFVLADSD
jgi:hypothetical protein